MSQRSRLRRYNLVGAAAAAYFVILGLAGVVGLMVHDIATNGFGVG